MEVKVMSKGTVRSSEKEVYWRGHVESQASSRDSIRGYCRQHGLYEPSFHSWRRELHKRDAQRRLPAGGASRSISSGDAGLIAVKIVDDMTSRSTAGPTLEIEFPGGPLIRLREDVSMELLCRVMTACQRISRLEDAQASSPVRSC
jgi:hypothetical protein